MRLYDGKAARKSWMTTVTNHRQSRDGAIGVEIQRVSEKGRSPEAKDRSGGRVGNHPFLLPEVNMDDIRQIRDNLAADNFQKIHAVVFASAS